MAWKRLRYSAKKTTSKTYIEGNADLRLLLFLKYTNSRFLIYIAIFYSHCFVLRSWRNDLGAKECSFNLVRIASNNAVAVNISAKLQRKFLSIIWIGSKNMKKTWESAPRAKKRLKCFGSYALAQNELGNLLSCWLFHTTKGFYLLFNQISIDIKILFTASVNFFFMSVAKNITSSIGAFKKALKEYNAAPFILYIFSTGQKGSEEAWIGQNREELRNSAEVSVIPLEF